jgi:hypothetical protein
MSSNGISSCSIVKAKFTSLVWLLAIASVANAKADSAEEKCIAMASGSDKKVHLVLENFSVLEITKTHKNFSIPVPADYSGTAIQCGRLDIVPAENDWKVLQGGYPLYISHDQTETLHRRGVLTLKSGRLRFEIIDGPGLDAGQIERMGMRLDQMQKSYNAAQ